MRDSATHLGQLVKTRGGCAFASYCSFVLLSHTPCLFVLLRLQKRAEVYNNVKRAEAASTVISFFCRKSQDDNCCVLCKRDFQSEEERGA